MPIEQPKLPQVKIPFRDIRHLITSLDNETDPMLTTKKSPASLPIGQEIIFVPPKGNIKVRAKIAGSLPCEESELVILQVRSVFRS